MGEETWRSAQFSAAIRDGVSIRTHHSSKCHSFEQRVGDNRRSVEVSSIPHRRQNSSTPHYPGFRYKLNSDDSYVNSGADIRSDRVMTIYCDKTISVYFSEVHEIQSKLSRATLAESLVPTRCEVTTCMDSQYQRQGRLGQLLAFFNL